MCVHNFLKVMRCEWDVLWHRKSKRCVGTLSVGVAGVYPWLHLSPLGNRMISSEKWKREGFSVAAASRTPTKCSFYVFIFGGRDLDPLFWCLMWGAVDHIWGKEESDTRVTAQPREKWKRACSISACMCNTSDTPGLPYTFDSRVFWGLVTFSSPLSTFLSAESTWKTLFF